MTKRKLTLYIDSTHNEGDIKETEPKKSRTTILPYSELKFY